MNYSGKKNYYIDSLEEIEKLPKSPKPSLLLHACCGVCPLYPIVFLCPHFDVTIYFNNSNIYPSSEYWRRLDELKEVLGLIKRDYGYDIPLIEEKYDNEAYNKEVLEPYKDTPEGSSRCLSCYDHRLSAGYDYAEAHGFDYFTTVMSVSRQKSSQVLNMVGAYLESQHAHTKYFYSDFKKGEGYEKGRQMRLKYDLYNQLYCGCIYSYKEGLVREYRNSKKLEEK